MLPTAGYEWRTPMASPEFRQKAPDHPRRPRSRRPPAHRILLPTSGPRQPRSGRNHDTRKVLDHEPQADNEKSSQRLPPVLNTPRAAEEWPISREGVSPFVKGCLRTRECKKTKVREAWRVRPVIGRAKSQISVRARHAALLYVSTAHSRLNNTYSSMRRIRAGVLQGSTLSPLMYSAYINDIPRPSTGVQLALFADDTTLYLRSNSIGNILPSCKLGRMALCKRAIDELTHWLRLWRIDVNPDKPVMPYASPVFAHAQRGILYDLQIVQNKFCRRAADAPWSVKNSVLHRDLELSTISKYLKDASERFFDIANSHPNPLLVLAISYEPPPPYHFCRRPRNVLLDPPDDLTVEKLIKLNKMAID
ncbi:Probable RNA-directed DNA polymerase from transposon BS [Eumeta japonica]|uniref:Probable RNA-directed DNA polymerase from transposon BS n=1 Tax=Eumeta variegata TaxID=151549 RepID=A0A4C1VGL5_EUMVA|nr:Probable RNA-directed DNA polymerase from transposon BS [Eumeta japonica]